MKSWQFLIKIKGKYQTIFWEKALQIIFSFPNKEKKSTYRIVEWMLSFGRQIYQLQSVYVFLKQFNEIERWCACIKSVFKN